MKLRQWFSGIRARLLLLAAFPILALGFTAFMIKDAQKSITTLMTAGLEYLPGITGNIGAMDTARASMSMWLLAATEMDPGSKDRKTALDLAEGDATIFQTEQKRALDTLDSVPAIENQAERDMYKQMADSWEKLVPAYKELLGLLAKNNKDADSQARVLLHSKYLPLISTLAGDLEVFRVGLVEKRAKVSIEADRITNQASRTNNIVFSLAALMIVFLATFVAKKLAAALDKISLRLAEAADSVGSESRHLLSASQTVSSGATEAASALEETVSSIEELSSMVKMNADNAKQAASLSASSSKSAEEGDTEIKNLIKSMTDISESSKKIEEIINVIDDIAFQTNLLALNAAVEAARAGEQGKGFAVVAEAVRTLAQRSSEAAKDITSMIKESVTKISLGTSAAGTSGTVLKNIVTSVKKVSDLNSEIASASVEQANGIAQLSKAMNEIDQATQRNAATSEEVAASATETSRQSTALNGLVGELVFVLEGKSSNNFSNTNDTNHSAQVQASSPKFHSHPETSNIIPFDAGERSAS